MHTVRLRQLGAAANRRHLQAERRRQARHLETDRVDADDEPPDAFLIPGVDEGVLRKVASELIDAGGWDDPRRGMADHANENLHRTYVDLPPRLNTRRTSPITIDRSTAFNMS